MDVYNAYRFDEYIYIGIFVAFLKWETPQIMHNGLFWAKESLGHLDFEQRQYWLEYVLCIYIYINIMVQIWNYGMHDRSML